MVAWLSRQIQPNLHKGENAMSDFLSKVLAPFKARKGTILTPIEQAAVTTAPSDHGRPLGDIIEQVITRVYGESFTYTVYQDNDESDDFVVEVEYGGETEFFDCKGYKALGECEDNAFARFYERAIGRRYVLA